MALDPEIGLVGRDSTAALLESLIDRRGRSPLPIVVAFGPGGSGKTALLDHVERRCRPAVPVARVDLDETGSKSCRDILDAIFAQLRRFSHREFGRLRLARYELARLALTGSAQSEEDTDAHQRAKKLIARRITFLPKVTEAVADVAEFGRYSQWIGKLVRPVSRWLVAAAVVAPPWLRWMLAGKRLAAVLRWYEREAGRKLLGLSAGCTVDEVIVRVWELAASEDRHARLTLDRMLVAAFLRDLRAEYRWHRRRKVNCVLLLDGADLLSPFELNLFPPEQPEPRTINADFLELLAQERLEHPDVPLLVVATKQATSEVDDIALPLQPTEDGHARSNPVEAGRARYGAWLQAFEQAHGKHAAASAAYLPVWLRPFTLEQTRQFLAEWHRSRSSTAEDERLVQELHEVTRGHPLAVRLAIQVVDRGFRRDRVIPAVRTVFAARVPRDEIGAEPTESVADYLLLRFLQRFRASTVHQRARTRQLLARLAAPRRLDVDTIRLLAPGRNAEDTLSSLATYSFTERCDNSQGETGDCLVLHPLLRDLLAKELLETEGGGTYERVHRALRDHYATVGREGDRLYHELALGETTTVAGHLAARLGQDRGWAAELEAIAEAPTRPIDDPALARAAKVVERTLRPRVRRMEELVIALSQLRSCTSSGHRTAEVIDSVLRAYRALAADDPAVTPALDRYRVLLHAAEGEAPPVSPPQLPDYCAGRGRHTYPLVWPRRHTIRRVVLTAAVMLLLGYSIVYVGHRTWHCDRDGPLAVWAVTSTLWDDSRSLSKERGGQCIGVTDGVGNFMYDQRKVLADDTEVGELSRLIHDQNVQVLSEAEAGSRRPYVTVVVATMLSSTDEEPKRDISAGVNELRGVYLAQRDWNQFNTSKLKPNFLLRVLLANFGGNSEFAEQTAAQIRKLVARDPTVVAVTGMGQTRDSTIHAADLLGTPTTTWPGIPMVGSAPSGDGFSGKPEFFRVTAPNKRQAKVGFDFITKDDRFRGRKPYLVYNGSDRYSDELKNDYEQYLRDDQVSARPWLAPVKEEPYEADQNSTGGNLAQRVADICKESTGNAPRPLVIYSGRANEMPTLLDELSRSSCGRDAFIVGGDDLTQLETVGYRDLAGREDYVNGRLFFTTFGPTRDGWQRIRHSPQLDGNIERFFNDYQERENANSDGKAFRSGPNGHVMLAYDAVNLVLNAITRKPHGGSPIPNPNQVYDALRTTTGDAAYDGVTGRIDFGRPDPELKRVGADPVNKLLVVQVVVKEEGKLRSRYETSDGG